MEQIVVPQRRHANQGPRAERFDFVRKLTFFPDRIRAVLDGNLSSALSIVYLDVNTDICNHACTFCDGFYRSLHAAHIPWPRLERLIDEMQEMGVLAIVLAGDRGEPFLHPDFDKLLSKIVRSGIQYGLYTNGTCVTKEAWPWLPHATFIRISADAATAETHRLMHVYSAARDDFSRLVSNVERLSSHVADVGISFVLDSKNYREMAMAADLFLPRGAAVIEYKPQYLPGYTVDAPWFRAVAAEIREQLALATSRWQNKIVLNNQLDTLLRGNPPPQPLETTPRRCLTSLLRLVISTHGCYTCTPYRGEDERRVGDILEQSLQSVVESSLRIEALARPCNRICAYTEQNDALLAAQIVGAWSERPDSALARAGESGSNTRLSGQNVFV